MSVDRMDRILRRATTAIRDNRGGCMTLKCGKRVTMIECGKRVTTTEYGRRVTTAECGKRVTIAAIALLVVIATSACSASEATEAPTSPTPATVTENFEGSIVQTGSAAHAFVVTTTGPVSIQLTAVGPLATMALGVGLGSWDGINCTASTTRNENSRAGVVALSGTAVAGNYCARIYDAGNIPADWTVTYAVSVTHP